MAHRWLIATSGLAHLALAGGIYVSGTWNIERLEAPRVRTSVNLPLPAPAPSGAPVAAKMPPIERKKPKPPVIVQPDKQKPEVAQNDRDDRRVAGLVEAMETNESEDVTATCVSNCGEVPRAAPVCGDGSRDASEQCDDGNKVDGDGCSSACRVEVKTPKTVMVPPTVLSGLRIAGETQVHPSTVTQNAMIRADVSSLRAVFLVCVAADGSVAQASLRIATKYPEYDAALQSAIERWRYRPYTVGGAPVSACSTVEFHYTMR